ncbi:MAG: hypothetical protein EBX52_11190 [Proteobacteria bacterium]|nr:hypothetical protein [Pseudomonadota bacterium]
MYGELTALSGKLPDRWKEIRDGGWNYWFRDYASTAEIFEIYGRDIADAGVKEYDKERIINGRGPQYIIDRAVRMAEEIELAMDPSDFEAYSRKRARRWSDSDGEPCADRVLAQRDNYMMDRPSGAPARVIRIGMNIVCSSGNQGRNETESPYVAMGATMAATADVITRLGFGVEIVGFSYISGSETYRGGVNSSIVDSWPVKKADEPLDIGKIAVLGMEKLHVGCILNGTRKAGSALETPVLVKKQLGIDYVFSRSWHRDSSGKLVESDIREGMLGILQTSLVRG